MLLDYQIWITLVDLIGERLMQIVISVMEHNVDKFAPFGFHLLAALDFAQVLLDREAVHLPRLSEHYIVLVEVADDIYYKSE